MKIISGNVSDYFFFYSCSAASISLHVWYSELLLLYSELKNLLSSKMSPTGLLDGKGYCIPPSEMILSRKKQNSEAREKTHSPLLLFQLKYSQE